MSGALEVLFGQAVYLHCGRVAALQCRAVGAFRRSISCYVEPRCWRLVVLQCVSSVEHSDNTDNGNDAEERC